MIKSKSFLNFINNHNSTSNILPVDPLSGQELSKLDITQDQIKEANKSMSNFANRSFYGKISAKSTAATDIAIKTSTDEEIKRILADPRKMAQVTGLISLYLKKNELATQISNKDQQSRMVVPLNCFRQALKQVGIHLSKEQIQRFSVKGDLSTV